MAYSGAARSYYMGSSTTQATYYDGFYFPANGGTPTLNGQHTGVLSTRNYSFLLKKIESNRYYISLQVLQNAMGSDYLSGNAIPVTATTARSLAIAGDYIEDVESEDPNAYPDNGPLGLYFYIKQ